jgi:hypothetical protein
VVVAGASRRGPFGGGKVPPVPAPAERAFRAIVLADTWDELAVEVAAKGSESNASTSSESNAITSGGNDSLVEYPETGCGNWRKLAITEAITFEDQSGCATACLKQPGCVRANFQLRHPGVHGCTAKYSTTVGSCYLFGVSAELDCIKAYNPCWLLLEPRSDTLKPAVYSLKEKGAGCSNWRDAKIGKVMPDLWNHHMCAKECQYTKGCAMFNFQQRECADDKAKKCGDQVGYDVSGQFAPSGRCILLSDACQQESNQYWDLYAMSA